MTGGSARSRSHLPFSRDYRAAWRAFTARSVGENAPFPIRVRTEAERAAEAHRWLLAWEDPDGDGASVFVADVHAGECDTSV